MDVYQAFAVETRGESACFEEWASAVAADAEVIAWLASLPEPKRQPNLVFAAARWHGVPAPGQYDDLRRALLHDEGAIRATILQRSTQTNEVGRLASLAPVLAGIDGPLALVEAGASAGLCLYPDRYDYAWEPAGALGDGSRTVLEARVSGAVPIPSRPIDVRWRGGVDLNPLDVGDEEAMRWLATLVWPEQDERRARLVQAVAVTRADPPTIVRGDLVEELDSLVAEAGRHGTPVVFHSAVIAYLPRERRAAFRDLIGGLVADGRCHWVSNEGPGVVPGIEVPETAPSARFLLCRDGVPVAWTHGHGRTLDWL